MQHAVLYASLGRLSLRVTLSEGEGAGSAVALQLSVSGPPLDVDVESWVLPLGKQCGQDITPSPCYQFDGSTTAGAEIHGGSWVARTPFSVYVAKPISVALAVNAVNAKAARCNGMSSRLRSGCSYTIPANSGLRLFASVVSNLDLCDTPSGCSNPLPVARDRAANASLASFTSVEEAHAKWWASFWEKSAVRLPEMPDVQSFWYAMQYLLACSSRKGKIAPGLFGPWVFGDAPMWEGVSPTKLSQTGEFSLTSCCCCCCCCRITLLIIIFKQTYGERTRATTLNWLRRFTSRCLTTSRWHAKLLRARTAADYRSSAT